MSEGLVRGSLEGTGVTPRLWSATSRSASNVPIVAWTSACVGDSAKGDRGESIDPVGLVPGCRWMGDTSTKGDRGDSIDPMESVPCGELMGDTSAKGDRGESIDPMVVVPGAWWDMSVLVPCESFSTSLALVGDTSGKGDRYESFDPKEVIRCG